MTDIQEILKAKAEAVRDLANAIAREFGGSGSSIIKFAENWAQAVESMVPIVPEPASATIGKARWRDSQGDVWTQVNGDEWIMEGGVDLSHSLDYIDGRWGPLTPA